MEQLQIIITKSGIDLNEATFEGKYKQPHLIFNLITRISLHIVYVRKSNLFILPAKNHSI